MKRFYKTVEATAEGDDWTVLLDGKIIKTPEMRTLLLPTVYLAQKVVNEWEVQGDVIEPLSMPLTRFANASIDRTASMRRAIIEEICAYGKSDVLCYHVKDPFDLAELQVSEWGPLLDWLSVSHGIRLDTTNEILQIDQSPSSLATLKDAVSFFDEFGLTGLHALTTGSGSIVLGLALAEGYIDCEVALKLSTLEENYQMELWGEDQETLKRQSCLGQEIFNANQFMKLSMKNI